MKKYALLSVFDKSNIDNLAQGLVELGFTILSTGGTAKYLEEKGISVVHIQDYTGFPEVMNGRVKTLHPKVHGAILKVRDDENHIKESQELGIADIVVVAVNLYPFENVVKSGADYENIIENIDIGGPSMLRSAGKNHKYTTVLCDPKDYETVLKEYRGEDKEVSLETRKRLGAKAFSHTAFYDSIISQWFNKEIGEKYPAEIAIGARKNEELRYGENPHQSAAFYTYPLSSGGVYSIENIEQLHGKQLSYNNYNDMHGAMDCLGEFKNPAAVIVKHSNPCGVAIGKDVLEAYKKALSCDPLSSFGGIVAFNKVVEEDLAIELCKIFLEVIIAPDFSDAALKLLMEKPNIRLIKINQAKHDLVETSIGFRDIGGGVLLQENDTVDISSYADKFEFVTDAKPTEEDLKQLVFAFKVCKHVKSNAIVYVNDGQTVGIGAGQMSRVDSSKIGALKSNFDLTGGFLASDAFFPFRDGVDEAVACGVKAIIQPGGSIRDEEVIQAANEAGIIMVFTGMRHFRH